MLNRNDCDHRHLESLCFEDDIYNDFIDAAIREKQEAIRCTENKIAKNDLAKTFHVFKEHRLALSIRANNEVVKCERQFDDRVEAGETPMTGKHLFDEDT